MLKPFLIVTAIGAAFGLLLPTGRSPATAPAAAVRAPGATPSETKLERKPNGHFYVDADVGGHLVHFVVDTGATSVALTMDDAERLGIPFTRDEFTVVGSGASGPVRGKEILLDSVSVDGKDVRQVRGVVLEGLEVSLLGQAYLSRIGSVEMAGETMTLR
jgi:aspartyl protease family protein